MRRRRTFGRWGPKVLTSLGAIAHPYFSFRRRRPLASTALGRMSAVNVSQTGGPPTPQRFNTKSKARSLQCQSGHSDSGSDWLCVSAMAPGVHQCNQAPQSWLQAQNTRVIRVGQQVFSNNLMHIQVLCWKLDSALVEWPAALGAELTCHFE